MKTGQFKWQFNGESLLLEISHPMIDRGWEKSARHCFEEINRIHGGVINVESELESLRQAIWKRMLGIRK